jgi:hypothetical protein
VLSIVVEAEPVTLAVAICDGNSGDVAGLEEEIGPDGRAGATKVEGVEADVSL